MDFLRPTTWAEALAAKADQPDAVPLQGGTDVMVEINFAVRRPVALLDLTRVAELATWSEQDGRYRVGAAVPYSTIIGELGGALPGLAQAARTVGSPQIRNRGTVGGNLGAASPAGDSHPPLLAADAVIEVESRDGGVRLIPAAEFYLGVKRNALAPGRADQRPFHVPAATGPQYFSKVGTRNAMVIAVCSFARRAASRATARVGTGLGSAAPTPRRARRRRSSWPASSTGTRRSTRRCCAAFGELVARAASPIDDVRGTAGYRRTPSAVMARRTLPGRGTTIGKEGRLMRVSFAVNGREETADDVWEGESLLYVLRERLGLPGSKNACEQGECGSCTVYLDGAPVCACLVAAGQADGRQVRTVEGLAEGDRLDPLQEAFVECGAVQCGFCTPGLIVQAHDLLERVARPSDAEIREALAGNLCRCTGYEKILDAVRLAATRKAASR